MSSRVPADPNLPAVTQQATEPMHDLPLYGATMKQAVKRFFSKYATFHGRASRSEYWWVYLAGLLAGLVLMVVLVGIFFALLAANGVTMDDFTASLSMAQPPADIAAALSTFMVIVMAVAIVLGLALLLPTLALTVRRLHDGGFTGWWALLLLVQVIQNEIISFIGSIVMLIFMLLKSAPWGAKFDKPAYGLPHPYNAPYAPPQLSPQHRGA